MVVDDRFFSTGADGFEELNKLPFSLLNFAKVDELLDDQWSNLDLKQLLVVVYKRDDRILSTDVVQVVCGHRMQEVEAEPLTHIKFILIIAKGNQFD